MMINSAPIIVAESHSHHLIVPCQRIEDKTRSSIHPFSIAVIRSFEIRSFIFYSAFAQYHRLPHPLRPSHLLPLPHTLCFRFPSSEFIPIHTSLPSSSTIINDILYSASVFNLQFLSTFKTAGTPWPYTSGSYISSACTGITTNSPGAMAWAV